MIEGGHVFTGDGLVYEDLIIEITDGVITYANTKLSYTAPPGAILIDAREKTVMPGIIDAHVRGTENIAPFFSGNGIRNQFLMDGVTTTCNVGHKIEGLASLSEGPWHDGVPIGRAFGSGPQLVPNIPNETTEDTAARYQSVSNEAQISDAIDQNAASGASYIKISIDDVLDPNNPNSTTQPFDVTLLDRIIADAAAAGIPVRATIIDEQWISRAVGKQIQVIDYTPKFSSVDTELNLVYGGGGFYYYEVIYPSAVAIADVGDRGGILVPMISVMDRVQPWVRPETDPPQSHYEDVVEWFLTSSEGRIAYGSGYEPGLFPGVSMPEVNALHRAGLNGLEMMIAMTTTAAEACGAGDNIGNLYQGNIGDVIVLDGDVRVDITALDRVTHVILDGKLAKGEAVSE